MVRRTVGYTHTYTHRGQPKKPASERQCYRSRDHLHHNHITAHRRLCSQGRKLSSGVGGEVARSPFAMASKQASSLWGATASANMRNGGRSSWTWGGGDEDFVDLTRQQQMQELGPYCNSKSARCPSRSRGRSPLRRGWASAERHVVDDTRRVLSSVLCEEPLNSDLQQTKTGKRVTRLHDIAFP